MAKKKLAVVGNGMAGVRAVEEVLQRGGAEHFDIAIFRDEPYGNYNRIMLSNVLSGEQDPTEIFLNPLDWYRENDVALHVGPPLTKIDRAAKIVVSESGVREEAMASYSSPPAAGPSSRRSGASMAATAASSAASSASATSTTATASSHGRRRARALAIGGGLLGLEAARWLLAHLSEVHLVHSGKHLMHMQLDAASSAMLEASMRGLGAQIHLEKQTARVLGDECVAGVAFKDGSTLDCDLIVIATGIPPNAEIGLRAGLSVERAIVVDDQMRSVDDADVYAIGECAQHRGRVYGLVAPLWEQGKVFADHLTQRDLDAAYRGSKLATKLKVTGIELASMGTPDPEAGDELIQFAEPKRGVDKKLIVRGSRLVGAILLGDISKAAYLMQAFAHDAPLPEERLWMLFDLGAPSQRITLDEMPAQTQICNCNGVTKSALGARVSAGCRSAKAAIEAPRAGRGCGACKTLVAEVVLYYCGGAVEEDPSIHYYVTGVPRSRSRSSSPLCASGA